MFANISDLNYANSQTAALENADTLIIVTGRNELAIIFDKIGIDTSEVLKAATVLGWTRIT